MRDGGSEQRVARRLQTTTDRTYRISVASTMSFGPSRVQACVHRCFYFSLFDAYGLPKLSLCVASVCVCVCLCDEMRLDFMQGCSSMEAI